MLEVSFCGDVNGERVLEMRLVQLDVVESWNVGHLTDWLEF